ncbi:MAG: hypothetical protein GY796_18840 [Chloroflexi bacterium]|nr:hypothetical protein [Chloroflexota bacterium]
MATYTQTIHVSDRLYQRLNRQAQADRKTVDEFAEQMLERTLPPPVGNIPERWRADLEQLQTMSDQMLWRIAEAEISEQREDLYDFLLHARLHRQLTASEQEQLDILRDETDQLMLRKSYAYLLLHNRGHQIPDPYDVTSYE